MAERKLPTDYAGNSKKSKEEKPEAVDHRQGIEQVTTGEVIVKKPGLGARVKSLFFGEDFRNVTRYVTAEVLLPAARNLIVDAVTRGTERAVFGETRRQGPPQYHSRTSYHTTPPRPSSVMLPDQPPHYPAARPSATRPGQSVILLDRDEAELVLERMIDVLNQYEVVSVADMNDLVGVQSKHTDNKWGWYFLGTAQVRQVREGYLIDLPPVEAI